jgi:hypothetical protein
MELTRLDRTEKLEEISWLLQKVVTILNIAGIKILLPLSPLSHTTKVRSDFYPYASLPTIDRSLEPTP